MKLHNKRNNRDRARRSRLRAKRTYEQTDEGDTSKRVLVTLESNFINEKYEEIYNDCVIAPKLNKKPRHSDTITTSKSTVQSQSSGKQILLALLFQKDRTTTSVSPNDLQDSSIVDMDSRVSSTLYLTQNSGSTESINLLAEEERVEVNVGGFKNSMFNLC